MIWSAEATATDGPVVQKRSPNAEGAVMTQVFFLAWPPEIVYAAR
jgi:hypothetical protein